VHESPSRHPDRSFRIRDWRSWLDRSFSPARFVFSYVCFHKHFVSLRDAPIDTAGTTRVIDRRLSRRYLERPLGTHLSSMRVPARFFCYLGGPAAYTVGSFFKRVFSSACARRARALFFIMSGYPSSSLLVVFSVDAGEREPAATREKKRVTREGQLSDGLV